MVKCNICGGFHGYDNEEGETMQEINFKEVENVEDANSVDMKMWKFVTYDNGKYIFARRAKPLVL